MLWLCLLPGNNSKDDRKEGILVLVKDYTSHLFFFLCLISMIIIGLTLILGIALYGKEPYTPYTIVIGMLLLVSHVLIFESYLKHRRIAKATFKIIPCRKGVLRKIKQHFEICIRCFVVYIFTLLLLPITTLCAQLGHLIWIEFYSWVVSNYGLPTYVAITMLFALLLPLHGTYIAFSGKESNTLRFVTSILFSISLFMLYAFLSMNIYKL